jgi:hypothetical protein
VAPHGLLAHPSVQPERVQRSLRLRALLLRLPPSVQMRLLLHQSPEVRPTASASAAAAALRVPPVIYVPLAWNVAPQPHKSVRSQGLHELCSPRHHELSLLPPCALCAIAPAAASPNAHGGTQLMKEAREQLQGAMEAMQKLRIVTLGFGTSRQKMPLERWTNLKLSRCTCSHRHGLRPCRGKSAGVAKRLRSLISPPEITNSPIHDFPVAVRWARGECGDPGSRRSHLWCPPARRRHWAPHTRASSPRCEASVGTRRSHLWCPPARRRHWAPHTRASSPRCAAAMAAPAASRA